MTDMQVTEKIENKEIIHINKKVKKKSIENISKSIYLVVKRVFDIIAGICGIIILIPLTLIVWIINKINKENGPIFYSHTRIGKDGKPFKMHKYRTMCVDADKKLEKILSEDENLKKEWEKNRKLSKDPRITKVGRFLRKSSLDEFPNFIDVITGKMSLIGPRAVVPDELKKFGKYKDEILKVKPGITGYWASHGRSKISYEERVKMEYYYVTNISLWLDIKIFFKTIVSIINKTGAI